MERCSFGYVVFNAHSGSLIGFGKYVIKHFTLDKLERLGQCFEHLQVTEQTFAIMNGRVC